MKYPRQLLAIAVALTVSGLAPATTMAQDEVIEEIVTTGTRSSKPRTAADSTVPIDVISQADMEALGNTADLTDNIRALIPSFTATPATGDGSAFVRPTSLRGTAPDQTLVLINGKRRHRSALVQFFAPAAGNGAHGVDIGMIPGIAVKSVEVLRDGAASQYGSDAIAGVINFIMKDASEGGQVQVQYGEYFQGEQSTKVAGNIGLAVGDSGFINASVEWVKNDALSRGIQRPDAQALIDAGNTAVGQDAVFGDAPFAQTWGRPETEAIRVFVNSGFDISDRSQLYARFSYADTDGRYRFFYRNPQHSSLTDFRAQGFVGVPGGFTPYLDGAQKDGSIVLGVDGEFESGMTYDFSYGYGKNELNYNLNNTVNPSLPLVGICPVCIIPQRNFNNGGYQQQEVNVNADFSIPVSDTFNFAFGVEAREETYIVVAGETNASVGAGTSGLAGIKATDAGEFSRDNTAIYADVEWDLSDALLVQVAGRYENFSDFGDTLNGKLAARWRLGDSFAIRGAISNGFKAPTPGQANVQTVITTFDGNTGLQVEEGLLPTTSPLVIQAGGKPLTEETSINFSLGFTTDIGEWLTLTADVYQIEVSDRIYRTGDIAVPALPTDPPGAPARSISFYTNALDVKHSGLDVVATSNFEMGASSSLDLTLAYSYNKVEVTGQKIINGQQPVNDGLVEDIENNYPQHRWVLTGNTLIGDSFNVLARVNYYGEHYDERGRIGDAVNPSALISSTIFLDLEAGWQITDNWRAVIGGVNVLDEFVDEIGPPNANRLSVGLQYPRRTAANYEGGSWYLKGIFSW